MDMGFIAGEAFAAGGLGGGEAFIAGDTAAVGEPFGVGNDAAPFGIGAVAPATICH